MVEKKIRVALIGNPNSGKTTLFNRLTGSRQHVGNWPGKTVEKKEGYTEYKGYKIEIVDLPGTYSLTAYSIEELIARNYIVDERPDVVIDVIDSTNLERNLYLAIQLIELNANLILDFNMIDLVKKENLKIDTDKISYYLNTEIVETSATKGFGIENLLDKIIEIYENEKKGKRDKQDKPIVVYGKELEEHLNELKEFIDENIVLDKKYNHRWVALKLLENDKEVINLIKDVENGEKVITRAQKIRKHLEGIFGEDPESIIADSRYGFIHGIIKESVEKKSDRISISDRIDKVVMNRFLGIPIFLTIMFLIFKLTFEIASPISDYIDEFFGFLCNFSENFLNSMNAPPWLISLINDGIIAGVGSVLVFIPFIFMLFFIIAILEDCGYMARAAFVMDKAMHKIGLHGKSFIPLLLGFGCNVPGIMATRVLENEKDRIQTILINPFMSCSARLPVYVLFTAAFFPDNGDMVVYSLYILGIVVAIVMGLIFKNTLFKGLSSPFVMELPPYRMPTLRGTMIHMWERGYLFIKKAGTIIFATIIIIWLLASLPVGVEYGSENSYAGIIGKMISPIFEPLGFSDYRVSTSLLFGFVAKEVVVGSLGALYGVTDVENNENMLIENLHAQFTPLSAYSFLVFVLLYAPCVATIGVIREEIGWKWAIFTAIYTTIIAWFVAFLVYQVGSLIGF
ncbi:MAG TPA: ferrous iron transport protein B [Candidatus Altiarchaeales archaeon]|nr:ferrous iron transport protein B [Candidatus Altiarchaeales archaeon]HEX55081.1 ferrous iron transport protein B [Candidatus Altiarchaeales archaeon]